MPTGREIEGGIRLNGGAIYVRRANGRQTARYDENSRGRIIHFIHRITPREEHAGGANRTANLPSSHAIVFIPRGRKWTVGIETLTQNWGEVGQDTIDHLAQLLGMKKINDREWTAPVGAEQRRQAQAARDENRSIRDALIARGFREENGRFGHDAFGKVIDLNKLDLDEPTRGLIAKAMKFKLIVPKSTEG